MYQPVTLKRFSFVLLFFLVACSQSKDSFTSRTYHNLTSHYNGYYHAGLKVKEGVDQLASLHVDKYDRILKMYRYADATKAKSIAPLMDEAMKKLGVVITRHTMMDKHGNEKPDIEKWIDDNWLLYGQALFYKHDYFAALETFEFVESTYRNSPTRHLASMWIAKTYLELTQLNEAESKLDYIKNQKDFPPKNIDELQAVSADYYLQVRNYPKAIIYLNKAAMLARKREDRIRFLFILGQVYEKQNEQQKAFDVYSQAIKLNPKYEMEFNARINRARCYTYNANAKKSIDIHSELLKMQKDVKNKEYLDQIYYALAGLEQKQNHEDAAIGYLNKSIEASTVNTSQKALTYLELGKIYYARPDYRSAQMYYDSCLSNISEDHPDHSQIVSRRNSLTRLVRNLNTIQREDSLQRLAKLNPDEIDKVIQDVVEEEKKQAELQKKKEEERSQNQVFDNNPKTRQSQAGSGSWYFYNAGTVSFGFNDFKRKWGDRKLEDGWRRSQKEQVFQIDTDAVSTGKKALQADSLDAINAQVADSRKAEFLKNVPATPELVEKSNNKIMDAFYSASMIYKDQLDNPKEAIKMLEELLKRYPKGKYELPCYYQLYRLYAQTGNTTQSNYYKNIILNDYPQSDYAQIILNPNYAAEKAKEKSKLELFYEETYRRFMNGEYATVIQRKAEAEKEFPENILIPKFDYLKTLSLGRTQSVPVFEASLQDIIRNYPEDPVKDQAQEILDYIHSLNEQKAKEIEQSLTNDSLPAKKYTYTPDTTHYIMVVMPISGFNANAIQKKIEAYNAQTTSTKEFKVSNMVLDHRQQFILIKGLNNKDEALIYAALLFNNDDVYGNLNPGSYQQLLISVNNYSALIKDRKLSDYLDFYNTFYK